jgi:putative addiction module killer protein
MRIDFGPGYRVYYKRMGKILIVLFCGGTKGTQAADIKRAVQLSKLEWE